METSESYPKKDTGSITRISISIPTRLVWSLVGSIALIYFTYLQMVWYVLPGIEIINTFTIEDITAKNIGLVWPLIIGYILLAITSCSIINIGKPLKRTKELGLIKLFIVSFIAIIFYFLVIVTITQLPPQFFGENFGQLTASFVESMFVLALAIGCMEEFG